MHSYIIMFSLFCEQCGEETDHQPVSDSHNSPLKCELCGFITQNTMKMEKPSFKIKTILSRGPSSENGYVLAGPEEILFLNDSVITIVEDIEIVSEITGIELAQKRVNSSQAKEIMTLWTRETGRVIVKFSVHSGYRTIPLIFSYDGDEEFEVGQEISIRSYHFRITHIKMRDGLLIRRKDKKGQAKAITRVYGLVIKNVRRNYS